MDGNISEEWTCSSSQCALILWENLVFSSVQLLSRVRLLAIPWTAARQASLSITNSWSSPKPMSVESVMSSNRLILFCPLLLLPSIFPSIKVFLNESALHIRWPKYWSFSFNISSSNESSILRLILWCREKTQDHLWGTTYKGWDCLVRFSWETELIEPTCLPIYSVKHIYTHIHTHTHNWLYINRIYVL